MNLRTLKKSLPPGMAARRQGDHVIVAATENGRPVEFRVAATAGWEERELARYLASKMPVAVVLPPNL